MRASLGAGVVVWVYLDWAVGLHGIWFSIKMHWGFTWLKVFKVVFGWLGHLTCPFSP